MKWKIVVPCQGIEFDGEIAGLIPGSYRNLLHPVLGLRVVGSVSNLLGKMENSGPMSRHRTFGSNGYRFKSVLRLYPSPPLLSLRVVGSVYSY